MPESILTVRGLTKRYPGVVALDQVDFDVRGGEAHALMGQNGAGKSTLIRILAGAERADDGSLMLDGRALRFRTPVDAQRAGITTVYQELNLVPSLSVAENLLLGRLPRRLWGIDWAAARRIAREQLAHFGLRIDVAEPLGSYAVAVQQLVAIARAVMVRSRLLVLDEPTSSLDAREVLRLFELVRRIKARGIGVVFITHFLNEAYELADRITVLRNGRRIGTFEPAELPRLALVAHMLGHAPDAPVAPTAPSATSPVSARPSGLPAPRAALQARRLGRRGRIAPFDLDLHAGEVLGFAGLLGAGRTEAARLLFAADAPDSGEVFIDGRLRRLRGPRDAIAHGLAFCPEDRKSEGLFAEMSVLENIVLVVQRRLGKLVSRETQLRTAHELARRLGIVTPDLDRPARHLSGGNQQKVILARWLAARPRILLLDEPTRGIDVGAKAEIERLVAALAAEGVAILFISSELEEVARDCQRVAVLRDRRFVKLLAGEQVRLPTIMRLIAGEAG